MQTTKIKFFHSQIKTVPTKILGLLGKEDNVGSISAKQELLEQSWELWLCCLFLSITTVLQYTEEKKAKLQACLDVSKDVCIGGSVGFLIVAAPKALVYATAHLQIPLSLNASNAIGGTSFFLGVTLTCTSALKMAS